tara:strand:- start:1029 stop:1259 length:231 start_codon:yes stop_codon:yes gene_type:complete
VNRKSFDFEDILAWIWHVSLLSVGTGTFIFMILDETGLWSYIKRVRPIQLAGVWLIFNTIGSAVFCKLLFRYFKSR